MKYYYWAISLYFSLFFLASALTPLMVDDFGYQTYFIDGGFSIFAAIEKLKIHYFNWGGRVLAHFIAGLLLAPMSVETHVIGRLAYALLNTFVLFISIYFSTRILFDQSSVFKDKKGILVFSAVTFFFTVNCKYHLQTMFWTTGSANYLWMFAFLVAFLFYAREFFIDSKKIIWRSKRHFFVLILLGFFAGLGNENVGVSLLAVFAFQIGLRFFRERKLSISMNEFFVGLSLLISTLFLVLAPGNRVRALVVSPEGPLSIVGRLQWWIESFLVFLGRPEGFLVLLLVGLSLWGLRRQGHSSGEDWKLQSSSRNLFLLFLLMCLAYLGHDGNFYGRKSFNVGMIFNLFCIQLLLVSGLKNWLTSADGKLVLRVSLVLTLISSMRWVWDSKELYNFNTIYMARESEILKQKDNGVLDVKVGKIINIFRLDDLHRDPGHWTNAPYAKYLGVNSIQAVD